MFYPKGRNKHAQQTQSSILDYEEQVKTIKRENAAEHPSLLMFTYVCIIMCILLFIGKGVNIGGLG